MAFLAQSANKFHSNINLHTNDPNSATSHKTLFKETRQTYHLTFTPNPTERHNSHFFSHLQNVINYQLFKPTRHVSLNYDKRDKYISHCNSYILKKVYRINQKEDHNLQFISRSLACENDLYNTEDLPENLSPELSLRSSVKNRKSAKTNTNTMCKSPFMFKFTRIQNFKFSDHLQEITNDEIDNKVIESALIERKMPTNQSFQSDSEEKKDNFFELEEENKNNSYTPYSKFSEKEKRIYDFLEKENILWTPMIDQKDKLNSKNKTADLVKVHKPSPSLLNSDLLKRRNFKNLKINLSSSCDDLTAMVNAQSIPEETD